MPAFSMAESLRLGRTRCDFIRPDDFYELCRQWLLSQSFHHVVTLNPEMVMLAEEDDQFQAAIGKADIRVPDGAGLIWAQWYLRSEFWALFPSLLAFSFRETERIPGVDTVMNLAELVAQTGKSIYLLGGTNSQVAKTAARLVKKYPELLVYTSPDHQFSLEGPPEILADIREKCPDILLTAYGAPNQSIWIEFRRAALPSVRIAVGVGGAFAILSEERPRAPLMFRKLNIEWLWRLWLEPARFPRIWNAVVRFPLLVRQQKQS